MFSLYKRNRIWYGSFKVGKSSKRISLKTRNKEDAIRIAKSLDHDLVNANFGILDNHYINFDELCSKFLDFSEKNHACSTNNDYIRVIKTKFLPYFKNTPITHISSESVEKFKQYWLERNNPVSVNKFLRYLKSIFGKAVLWDYLKNNPVSGIREIRVPEKRDRYLELWEIEKVLANSDRLKLFLLTALNTGMRKAELQNLLWNDVDFNNKRIIVCNTKEFHTKNYKNRIIPMTTILYGALYEEYQIKKSKYVFKGKNGKMYFTIKGTLQKICFLSGVESFCLHDLRRSFASHLSRAGVPAQTIQILLGHKDITTTLGYIKQSTSSLNDAVSMLEYGKSEQGLTNVTQIT